MEIMYTIAPFIIVGVLFYYTILAQNAVLKRDPEPDVEINVVGQKWSWTFNYKSANNPAVGQDVWNAGTINATSDLFAGGQGGPLQPVVTGRHHSFWVPSFYQKLDVIPGRSNNFFLTPTKEGVFRGKCAELCGTYHRDAVQRAHRQ